MSLRVVVWLFALAVLSMWLGWQWSARRRRVAHCNQYGHHWIIAENPKYQVECTHCYTEV